MCACVVVALLTLSTANLESEPAASVAQGEQSTAQATDSLTSEEQMVRDIIARSFPDLEGVDIRLKVFRSDPDYFRTSFNARGSMSISRSTSSPRSGATTFLLRKSTRS